jgi:hypothetical protein
MFIHKLNQVIAQTRKKCPCSQYIDDSLYCAIGIWCNQLAISQDIKNYILMGYMQKEIRELINYIYREGKTERRSIIIPNLFSEKSFNQHINALFKRMNLSDITMEFIVLIAFVITAVGYWVYLLNYQQQQQSTHRKESRQYKPSPPFSTAQSSPTQRITKQFLVLVVSASQENFIESLGAKRYINYADGTTLYEITKYLWLGSKTSFSENKSNVNQYEVSLGEESEYDIYLVYIELNKADEGFEPNVGQLDRYYAFRNLGELANNFTISPRLQMEAYGNFDVYSR